MKASLFLVTDEELEEEEAQEAERLACRRRRLVLALADLGLLDIVGPAWVRVDRGFEFLGLDSRTSDRFTCAIEDLARGSRNQRPARSAVDPSQLSFDFDAVPPRQIAEAGDLSTLKAV